MGWMTYEVPNFVYTSCARTKPIHNTPAWTLNGVIQPHIDVYVSKATFTEVQRSFPYMVAKEFASGGGDVSEAVVS